MIHNPEFNHVGFDTVRLNAGLNSFTISPSKMIETKKEKAKQQFEEWLG